MTGVQTCALPISLRPALQLPDATLLGRFPKLLRYLLPDAGEALVGG